MEFGWEFEPTDAFAARFRGIPSLARGVLRLRALFCQKCGHSCKPLRDSFFECAHFSWAYVVHKPHPKNIGTTFASSPFFILGAKLAVLESAALIKKPTQFCAEKSGWKYFCFPRENRKRGF